MALMSVRLEGVSEFMAAIDRLVAAADIGAREATGKGAHLIEAETKKKLAESSHPKGTPTPAAPGQPPSLVAGQLRRSIRVQGPARLGPGRWESKTGPTAVYGRIQELGGNAGRGGATYLPARPYLGPALDGLISSGALEAVYREAWRTAWYRG